MEAGLPLRQGGRAGSLPHHPRSLAPQANTDRLGSSSGKPSAMLGSRGNEGRLPALPSCPGGEPEGWGATLQTPGRPQSPLPPELATQ